MVGIFAVITIAFAAFSIISLLTQRQKGPGASDFEGPRVEDGAVIPVVYGCVSIAPLVPWWGDPQAKEVKKGVALAPDPTIGYDYYAGVQCVLCWGPIDRLIDVVFDETKSVAGAGTQKQFLGFGSGVADVDPITDEGTLTPLALPKTPADVDVPNGFDIFVPSLHGGYQQGGVTGTMRFYWGGDAQPKNDYLETNQQLPFGATQLSGFPQLCYAVFEAFRFGRSPTLPPVRFVVERCPNVIPASGGGLHGKNQIAGADGLNNANAAHMIWEIMTDTGPRGCGVASVLLDAETFRDAADTLHTEGFGLSLVFDGSESGWDNIAEILRHVGGVVRTSRKTGLIEFKLLRGDYLEDLPEITPDDFTTLNVSRPTHRQLVTEINLGYTDRARNFQRATERAWNQSLWDVTGERKRERVDFLGITDRSLAQKVAARECAQLSLPLAKVSGPVSRRISTLCVGDVFLLTSPEDGLFRTPMRLLGGEFGTIRDGKMQIDAIEDLYAAQGAVFANSGTGGTDPGLVNFRRPDVQVVISETGTLGTVELLITDPDGRVTAVEFNTKSGLSAESGYVADPSEPYEASVALDPVFQSFIAWRVTYTAADGTSDTLEDTVFFAQGQQIRILGLIGAVDGNGMVTITASVTPDVASVKCDASTAGFPSDATVRATTADASSPFVFTFGPIQPGETLYVKAFGYDASANEGLVATTTISRAAAGQPFTVQCQFGNRTIPAQNNDEWEVEVPACNLLGAWRIFAPDGVTGTATVEVYKVATDGTATLIDTLTITSAETASGTLAGAPIAFNANQRVLFKVTAIGSFTRLNVSLDATR